MAVNVNGTKLKKCNFNGNRVKYINVNGTRVWADEYAIISSAGADYNGGWSGLSSVYLNRGGSWGSLTSAGLYNMKCVGSYGNHGGAVNVVSNQKIDLSQGNTLTLTYKIHDSDAWGPPPTYKILLASNRSDYFFPGDGGNSAALKGTTIFAQSISGNGSGILNTDKTVTIDVSNYNSSYYIDFYACAGVWTTSGKTAQWDVYSLILSD